MTGRQRCALPIINIAFIYDCTTSSRHAMQTPRLLSLKQPYPEGFSRKSFTLPFKGNQKFSSFNLFASAIHMNSQRFQRNYELRTYCYDSIVGFMEFFRGLHTSASFLTTNTREKALVKFFMFFNWFSMFKRIVT